MAGSVRYILQTNQDYYILLYYTPRPLLYNPFGNAEPLSFDQIYLCTASIN